MKRIQETKLILNKRELAEAIKDYIKKRNGADLPADAEIKIEKTKTGDIVLISAIVSMERKKEVI